MSKEKSVEGRKLQSKKSQTRKSLGGGGHGLQEE
jgi:hypothetical protein